MEILKLPKPFQTLLGVALIGIVGLNNAHATILNPGETILARWASEPVDASLVVATNAAFTSDTFSGVLLSKVWACDAANPWGGLTFAYRLVHDHDCEESFGWLNLDGFSGLQTDVNYSGVGFAPREISRSESGATISFGFSDRSGNALTWENDKSSWLIIQTDSNSWRINQVVGMDSVLVPVSTFAPVAVPEPAAVSLAAIASLIWRQRRR